MDTVGVVVIAKLQQLAFETNGIPAQGLIEIGTHDVLEPQVRRHGPQDRAERPGQENWSPASGKNAFDFVDGFGENFVTIVGIEDLYNYSLVEEGVELLAIATAGETEQAGVAIEKPPLQPIDL